MAVLSAGSTHIGMKRKSNQDSIVLIPSEHFYVVADGMGGHQGGDIASQMAVAIAKNFVQNDSFNQTAPKELLKNYIHHVNQKILEESEQKIELKGMGTTLSVLHIKNFEAFIGNVGDSRVYLINKGQLFQLTRDHSYVQEKLNLGIYNREDAAKDKQKNVLTKSVGIEEILSPDVFHYKISKGDIFLICSDGLHGRVSDKDILFIVQKYISTPNLAQESDVTNAVNELISLANKNGGQDNISAIIVLPQE